VKRTAMLIMALCLVAWAASDAAVAPRPAASLKPPTPSLVADAIMIPRMLSYQGKLTDSLGIPVSDTVWPVLFRLYPQPTGGSHFWQESQNVRTDQGLFSVLLGSSTPISSVPDAGGLFLSMKVGADPEMIPRVRIVSAAYSYLAEDARHADTADYAVSGGIPDSIPGSLAIGGELRVHSKARLGYSCYNNGFAAFCAGYGNSASGDRASITGGEDNSAGGKYSHISGGSENQASALWATISGGNVNEASDSAATVGGGRENFATASHSAVAGGYGNDATGAYSFVGGGYDNTADTAYSSIGGGYGNVASAVGAAVGGGYGNEASGADATVGGGQNNDAGGGCATVGGGQLNNAADICATVSGGQGNDASGYFSVIPGGRANFARGYLSFAAGTHAHASHHACFVWGDSTQSLSDSVYTTGSNQWHVRARGGVWFYSNLAMTKGVYLAPSSNSWTGISYEKDGSAVPVDRHALLERLATVPVREYRLDGQDESVRHIGPTAHEYRAALGYGETEAGINMADADGVALAAIQALYEGNKALRAELEALKAELAGRK
jgi:hypothetical protein